MQTNKAHELYKSAFIHKDSNWMDHTIGHDEMRVKLSDGVLIFVFDGSGGDIKEWINNLKIKKVDDIHRGFKDSADKFTKMICDYIKTCDVKKIQIITYSRGVFILLALDELLCKFPSLYIDVVTFAAPKVGKLLYSYVYKCSGVNIKNIVLRGDVVHLLPPRALGYRENLPGETIYYGSRLNWIWPRVSKHVEYFTENNIITKGGK